MDSKNRIIEQLQKVTLGLTEELLVSLTNKGTVNRAKKDLEKLRGELSFEVREDETVTLETGPEALVVLKDSPAECTCTCPSASMCRHIIMAFLLGQEQLSREVNPDHRPEQPKALTAQDMKELNCLTPEEVLKIVGKKEYTAILCSLRQKNEVQIIYEQMLKVSIPAQEMTVYFPRDNSIAGAVCSCKDKGMCRHKSYGLMAYLTQVQKLSLELPQEDAELTGEQRELLIQVRARLAGYLDKGMSGLLPDTVKELERLYIRTYGVKLYSMAGEIKLLASYFHEYFEKNIDYSNLKALHLICKIHNRTAALETAVDDLRPVLAGRLKEESIQMDSLTLLGMGAATRLTKRKDLLVSQYFYCTDLKAYLILSTLRPVEKNMAERTASYLYSAGLFWAEEYALKQLSGMKITVRGAMVSGGKISGTKMSSGKIEGQVGLEELKKLAITDFTELLSTVREHAYQYFAGYRESENLYLLALETLGEARYDEMKQRLLVSACDKSGQEIVLEIRYSEAAKKAVEIMEKEVFRPELCYVLVKASERRGKLWGELLTGFDSCGAVDIYF